jgi:hypothetical protein
MEQIKYSGFPPLLDDLDALQKEINAMLKKAWLMLGGIVLPCAALAFYALAQQPGNDALHAGQPCRRYGAACCFQPGAVLVVTLGRLRATAVGRRRYC